MIRGEKNRKDCMEAKLQPYYYRKGNELEIAYINPTDGFKISIADKGEISALLIPLEEIEELVKYVIRTAKISGNTLSINVECKMRALDVSENKAAKFDKMEDEAISILEKVLKGDRDVDDLTKVALQSLNIVAKTRQTLTNRQAIGWSIAHTIANPEELKRYIAVTNPELTKILNGRKQIDSHESK